VEECTYILVFMNHYDMMGITMGLQASPLSMESGSGNELARGVCGCGIKYSDVRYLSHFSHTLVRCGMPVAVQIFEVGEVMTKEGDEGNDEGEKREDKIQ
jgi:hypothetical protein